jgi:hypothetical protein
MKPKFRLEDVDLSVSANDASAVIRTVRINYTSTIQPRCDGGDHCYGCNSAEPKKPQKELKVYLEAAA